MSEMTTHKRVKRIFEHREADRIPITDSPWETTIQRWHREGMPEEVDFTDYFGLDKFLSIQPDNSPRFPEKVLEETDAYVVKTTEWGSTMKFWKDHGGTPEHIDFTVKDPSSWRKVRARMKPDRDRIDWKGLKRDFHKWRKEGAWISGVFWFGFDVTHAYAVGTEQMLIAMATRPEWVRDMFNHYLDVAIALYDMIWEAGYHFDSVFWYDDMGYKGRTFFSPEMYRDMLKPAHRRACDWARAHGIKTHLHSCGNISAFIPDLVEIGLDMLNPLEVKSGLDPVALKKEYGDRLGFHGGLNAVLYSKPEKMWAEMRHLIPILKENGGYIASSDHSVPETVGLEEFREFVHLAKELGSYE
jgi:uroporphyrinogen decarboxylase